MAAAGDRGAPSLDAESGSSLRALSVSEIIETGLRLGRRYGFEAVSMRTLAKELNVSTMALYYHVPNKRGLLVLLVDSVLGGIAVPPPEFGDWQSRLRELQARSVRALGEFQGLDRVMYDMPPTPEGWRLMDGYVEILLEAGLPEREAALAFSVLHSSGMGRATMERDIGHSRERGDSQQQGEHPAMPALDRLDGEWGRLRRPDYHDFAMDVILAGLRSMLASPAQGQPPTSPRPPTSHRPTSVDGGEHQ